MRLPSAENTGHGFDQSNDGITNCLNEQDQNQLIRSSLMTAKADETRLVCRPLTTYGSEQLGRSEGLPVWIASLPLTPMAHA